jgi:hypothetical protein
MRHAQWMVLLALLSIAPQVQAQAFKKAERTERRIAQLMDRLREEMWAYRQELDFFRRAPEYAELVELRYRSAARPSAWPSWRRGAPAPRSPSGNWPARWSRRPATSPA